MFIPKRIIGMEKKGISTVGRSTWPGPRTSTASSTANGMLIEPTNQHKGLPATLRRFRT